MTDKEIKLAIQSAIISLATGSLTGQSISFFKTLGYKTERQNPFTHKTFAFFKESFLDSDSSFNEDKALVKEWKSVDLLFQLTKDEVSDTVSLFDTNKVDNTIIETYLFFALELKNPEYTRTALAQITREINKVFPMPVMLLFKHGEHLTLSVINRRLHKKDEQKDVLEKVTLIKDISTLSPHRAHIEILFDLSFNELKRIHKFTNFIELHNAWQKTLDTKELNKRFYRELSNWYFWALNNVSFPNDIDDDKDDTVFNSESIIRLLTRLIFIWFIKEKNLIPEKIFEEKEVSKLIKGFNTKGSTVYYRAILQNLFFATLNQKIEERVFATDGAFKENKKNYGIKNLYRYSSDFAISKDEVIKLFEGVPFLNGGLFDCLDSEDKNGKVIYLDGFSRNSKKQAHVPDELFFSKEKIIDLSDVYDDKKKKNETVKGLFEIFKQYKFTVTENTPIEEEIALDPELLGRVFENLLASYNPETKTTARKQTGSFYTPREIVNYMVDESLKAYLKQKLETEAGMKQDDAEVGLEFLLGYNEKEHLFNKKQTAVLINAIDSCKILDPACGSGAFPMGILHKLVHILHNIDPQNKRWKERQIKKAMAIDDTKIRDNSISDIETAFNNNELDYGRKLYLIENCIYGVDIQPIATQISKLRFFISLIVDQKADRARDNFGIRPLPNLETKFVVANTLIGIDKPKVGDFVGSLFDNTTVKELEEKLKDVRHRLFSAKTPAIKRKLREEDAKLRGQMGEILEGSGWSNESSRQLAGWDPYNQNASSPFFDPEWMFGIADGFDVVIGNPPYIKESTDKSVFDGLRKSNYYQGKMDLWYFFASVCIDMLKKNLHGCLCFIATNNWITNSGASQLRNKILTETEILKFIDFSDFKIFESAGIQTMVFVLEKKNRVDKHEVQFSKLNDSSIKFSELNMFLKREKDCRFLFNKSTLISNEFINKTINFSPYLALDVLQKIESKRNFNLLESEINSGIDIPQDVVNKSSLNVLGNNYSVGDGIFVLSDKELEDLNLNQNELSLIKPFYTTSELYRYNVNSQNNFWIIYTDSTFKNPKSIVKFPNIKKHLDKFQSVITSENKPYGLNRSRDEKFFKGERIIVQRKCSQKPSFVHVSFDAYFNRTFIPIRTERIDLKYLSGLLNSKLTSFWLKYKGKMQGDNYQVDKDPILTIPILNYSDKSTANNLVSITITSKDKGIFEDVIDAVFYELYFPEEIKAADAEVLKHLTSLPELKDDWSDEKKMKVIEKVYKELSDPKHPVSIAMEKQKTVPEVRIIEGLDK
ncbi:MAG: N-6 DNA methylase [Thermodesulfovibrionia bacterium]|nr:N-6 DNA methylase [Thermodesulfovibrionia bacterium]